MTWTPEQRAGLTWLAGQAAPVVGALAAQGHRAFLVGGVVRDLVLGRSRDAPDIDLTTDARPPQIIAALTDVADDLWTQGQRFGTIACRAGGRLFEITTHRSEAYVAESRKPVVEFSEHVEVDLSRRDFTVNAMAIELPQGELIDPFGGIGDLRSAALRTPLSAEISFSDDPLRMLRAARFVAGYGLVATGDVEAAMRDLRGRLAIVSRERIRDELDKLLALTDPTAGFELLHRTGVLHEFLPEAVPGGFAVVAGARALAARRAALFVYADRARAAARLAELRYSSNDQRDARDILDAVDRLAALDHDRVGDAAARRLAHATGAVLPDAIALARLVAPESSAIDAITARLAALRETEDLDRLEPELDGDEVQALLGIAPGRDVGRALAFLLDLRLDEGLLGKAQAAARLREWWSAG